MKSLTARSLLLLSLFTLSVASTLPAFAAAGDVDTGFGTNGLTSIPGAGVDDAASIVPRKGGGWVLVSGDADTFLAVGLDSGGDLDPGFGTNGYSRITVPGGYDIRATDAVADGNGRILATGYRFNSMTDKMTVVRFKANGDPDMSFAGDAVSLVDFNQGDSWGYGLATKGSSILVTGEVAVDSGVTIVGVAQLKDGGGLNKDFGNGGRKVINPTAYDGYDGGWRAVPGPRGSWIISGWADSPTNDDTLILKLTAGGGLDQSFKGNGIAIYDLESGDYDYSYGLDKDGARIVVGVTSSSPKVLRLTAKGNRDSTFGNNGVYEFPSSFSLSAVAVDSSHRVLVVENETGLPVRRVKANGTADGGFGTGGRAYNPGTAAKGFDVLMRGDDPIVSGGVDNTSINVTRYLG